MARSRRPRRKQSGTRRKINPATLPLGVIKVSREGFGFVDCPEGSFFIPPHGIHGAMDGDTVRVRPRSSHWRAQAQGRSAGSRAKAPVGAVHCVVERASDSLVGIFSVVDGTGFVMPQDRRIDYLVKARVRPDLTVSDGDIVVVRLETFASRHESPSGVVERVLGRVGDPGIQEEIIAARHGLETEFPQEALDEAEASRLDIDAALREPDRRDLRDRFVLTIDPVDARDFDDALSVDYVDGVMRLGVHIADVSSYVAWDSALDREARKRTTSTYFPNRVIPMLPEKLSNGLCSLNPGEDRLAFTVDIYLDGGCNVIESDLYPSVIRSDVRLDYDSVQVMFDGGADYPDEQLRIVLGTLRKVGKTLFRKRIKRGALDFSSHELKVRFDEEGAPCDIVMRQRTEATDLIEEAMILANEVVASHMLEADASMVYRIHEEPNLSSLEETVPVLRQFGYASQGAPITSRQIQDVLDEARGTPEEDLVSMVLLRAMKQAVYRSSFTTHYGLASDGYTHFTSPIRRYPDLLAHRLLRLRLFEERMVSGEVKKGSPYPPAIAGLKGMFGQLDYLCDHSSRMEREAEQASIEALDVKICEYMEQFVGEEFRGVIANVLRFGFFVRIDNGCEGLVPIRDLDGWFEYDEELRVLRKEDSARPVEYHLGQRVKVRLVESDTRSGQLTFALAK
ncbi:MAG: ribonuclease R [Coriobacteriales bacterium]|jgi:ribonuclease R